MKGIVIGKEERSYTAQSGEARVSRTLYVIWDAPARQEEGFAGRRVESVYIPFEVSDINVCDYCDFEYEIRPSAKGSYARLVNITRLCEADILLDTSAAHQ